PHRLRVDASHRLPADPGGSRFRRPNQAFGGQIGYQAPPLLHDVVEDQRTPVLEGSEGARREGNRVRGRGGTAPSWAARRVTEAERPTCLPCDPVRGRNRLS